MQKLVDCENFTEECIKQYTTEISVIYSIKL